MSFAAGRRRTVFVAVLAVAAAAALFLYGRRRVEHMGGFPERVAARGAAPSSNDFTVYWGAAGALHDAALYQRGYTPDDRRYIYPPTLACLLRLARPLGITGGAILWFVLSVLGAVVGTAASVRLATGVDGSPRLRPAALAGGLLLAGRFIGDDLGNGNVNSIVFAITAAGAVAYARGRGVVGSVLFALAASIKLTPGLVLVLLVARRAWREAFVLVAAVLALVVGLPALHVGPARAIEMQREFVAHTLDRESSSAEAAPVNGSSLRAAIHRWFVAAPEPEGTSRPDVRLASLDSSDADRIWGISGLVLLAGLAFVLARGAPRGLGAGSAERTASDIALIVIAAALFSPLTRKAHLVSLILVGAVLGRRTFPDRASAPARTRRCRMAVEAAIVLFWLADRSLVGRRVGEWMWELNILFFATCALAAVLVALRAHPEPGTGPATTSLLP